jgi:hypothetical protein
MKTITIMVIMVKLGSPGPGPRRPVSGPRVLGRAGSVYLSGIRTQAVNIL